MASHSIFYVIDIVWMFYLLRMWAIFRIYRKVNREEGSEVFPYYYGVFSAALRIWVWRDKTKLRKPSYEGYLFKKL